MTISDLMTRNPECCTPDDSCVDAAQIMKGRDVGLVPIVESRDTRKLVGCITDRDIVVRVVAEGKDADAVFLGEIMTEDMVTCSESADVCECEQLMQQHQLRRILVTDEQGALMGVVSTADLARTHEHQHVGETLGSISQPTGAAPTV